MDFHISAIPLTDKTSIYNGAFQDWHAKETFLATQVFGLFYKDFGMKYEVFHPLNVKIGFWELVNGKILMLMTYYFCF